MPLSYTRIGRVDWARDWREKAERSTMTIVIIRLALLALFGTGMLTTSAFFAEVPPIQIDGAQVNFGLFVFVACVIGAVGFTWTAALQWSKLRTELRDAKKDIRVLKRKVGIEEEE